MIISCGESLIDFLPVETKEGEPAFRPVVGGSPLNVAIAVARLGAPSGFLGRLSGDVFGQSIRDLLSKDGVDLSLCTDTDQPSSMAFVDLSETEPRYAFYLEGTAGTAGLPEDVPTPLPEAVEVLHFGSVSLILEPGASTLEGVMMAEVGRRLISLDPNVRPNLIQDRDLYLHRLENWVRHADLVKVSAADLEWLYPDVDAADVAEQWHALGPDLVVVTLGGDGSLAVGDFGAARLAGRPVQIVDTVGAGDTFQGALLAELHHRGRLTRGGLGALSAKEIQEVLAVANRAAAVTCSRRGNNPPTRSELGE